MSRKWIIPFFMAACLPFLSGCWSSIELKELAIVSAYALDKKEDGTYVGTFQLINPMNVPGALQGGASGKNPSIATYTATGDNPLEVADRASTIVSRDLYFAHTSLLVISEELAREEGLSSILDAMERGIEFRTTTKIVISRDVKAGEFVQVLTAIDQVPAEKAIKSLEFTEELYGENIATNLQKFINAAVSTGKEPLVSGFSVEGDIEKAKTMEQLQSSDGSATIKVNGMGVFKEGKLVNWIDGEKSEGTLWVLDQIRQAPVNIDWENHEDAISYKVVRQKTNVATKIKDGKPAISVHIRAEGDLRVIEVPVDITNPHVLFRIEGALQQKIQAEAKAAIEEAQKTKTDIFGFGEKLHHSEPKVWQQFEKEWQDVYFPALDVDVTVEAFIRRTGMRNNPYLFDLNKKSE
ncbi:MULTISPECIES: Ger(x)C family spore germination protein [Oceanobacillus]|uniref:Ger(X)C family spore germination protein n=1 Tax=Oceanobacillus aidingensis TaxID=645964 RepID=A0ABV9JW95_9BACI|nr:Ger(x)C family spore germination protein [Oceanobacillus oncorhynchi]MDM8100217.1 Ger(x)C family spore germination protein [Oceanobacillus oncorhynchi]